MCARLAPADVELAPPSPRSATTGAPIEVCLVKNTRDKWPADFNNEELREGVRKGRYKTVHSGGEEDNEEVDEWVRSVGCSLAAFCHSASPALFRTLANGPYPPDVRRKLMPDYKHRRPSPRLE